MGGWEEGFDLSVDSRLSFAAQGPFNKILHLGCGWVAFKPQLVGQVVVNADKNSHKGVDSAFDLLDVRWPLKDKEFDLIFASHILEHIPIGKVLDVLKEARRVLRPGGAFIAEVPDIRLCMEQILAGNWGLLECVYGHDRYQGDQHRWGYVGPDLIALLHNAGFDRTVLGPGKCYHKVQLPVLRVEATYYGDNWTDTIDAKSTD